MFLAALLGGAAFIGGAGLTISSGWLITMASAHPPIMTLGVSIVLVRFFGIFRSVARYLERIVSHSAVFARLTSLRVELFSALDRRGLSAARDINSGTFVKALVDDVERGQEYQLRVVLPGLAAILSVGAGVGLGALIQPESLLITVPVSTALLFILPKIIGSLCKRESFLIEGSENLYSMQISAASVGAIEARMYGFLAESKNDFYRTESTLEKSEINLLRSIFITQATTVAIFGAATVATMALVFQLTGKGALPAVQITMIAFLPLVIFEAITAWYPNLHSAGKLILAQENIDRELAKDGQAIQKSIQVDPAVMSLKIEDMRVDWGQELADPVTFSMRRGDSLVLTGKSGSGKSTLAMGISGLLEYSGSCRINDTQVRDIANLPELLTGALQQSHIFATTLRENLKLAKPDATDAQLLSVLTLVELDEISLDEMLGQMGRALSGGEAKRLAVARALLSSAPIIVLDEPTEHLDSQRAQRIEASIMQACRERILIVITHSGWLNVGQRVTLARE
jgi:thiol reductant ABC exporter CydC subunit